MAIVESDDLLAVCGRDRGAGAAGRHRRYLRSPLVAAMVRRLAAEAFAEEQEQNGKLRRHVETVGAELSLERFSLAFAEGYRQAW